jgi:hypothetical protein
MTRKVSSFPLKRSRIAERIRNQSPDRLCCVFACEHLAFAVLKARTLLPCLACVHNEPDLQLSCI